jgi:hypothetical protein
MICPDCKCEYRAGVTQCSDCGVPLVEALASAPPPLTDDGGLESIWYSNDPAEYASAKEALQKAGVPFVDRTSDRYLMFPSLRPKMEIWVTSADKDRAGKALRELKGLTDPEDLTDEEIASLELPEKEGGDLNEGIDLEADPKEDWDEDAPSSEIWNGGSGNLADTLVVCLREIGIASRKLSEGGSWRVVVHPEQEARAKEIVREVVEASPPE